MKESFIKFWKCITAPFRRFWSWYKGLYKGPWWKKILTGLCTFIILVVLYSVAVISNFLWLFGKSPDIDDIIHPQTAIASEVYSIDGKILGRYFSENRQPVPYDSIAPCFFDALISTEDERFYQHHGVDVVGLFSAVKDAVFGNARGASTITQQLVKNMFRIRTQYSTGLLGHIPGIKILVMKSKEMIIATELECMCSKEDILRMYANTVDFGSNAFGIKAACQTYFDTTPSKLKPEEAAMLVGLLKATSLYNPRINPQNALERRNVVIDNLYTHKKITESERNTLINTPINLKYHVLNAYDGIALHYRQAVVEELKRVCPDVDPYVDGLKIFTTLDATMQNYAEAAVKEEMRHIQDVFTSSVHGRNPWVENREKEDFLNEKIKVTETYKQLAARFPNSPDSITYHLNLPHKVHLFDYDGGHDEIISSMDSLFYMLHFLHTGFVAIEPETGHVKSYVGDVDFRTWQHDNVAAHHQPGSTFKLFVYSAGMKQGYTPNFRIKDQPVTINFTGGVYRPKNAGGHFSMSEMTLHRAFAASVNTVAVQLAQIVGVPQVIKTAHDMGIRTELKNSPALALGVNEVNILELVSGYTTVANNGVHVEPTLISKVVDHKGKVIYQAKPKTLRALDERSTYFMRTLLWAGSHEGTSRGIARYIGNYNGSLDYGGKTGTTNSGADGWFVCATPSLVAGAWVGGEYRSIHFRGGAYGQGAYLGLPIVGHYLQSVLADKRLNPKYLKKYPKPTCDTDDQDFYSGGKNLDSYLQRRYSGGGGGGYSAGDSLIASDELMEELEAFEGEGGVDFTPYPEAGAPAASQQPAVHKEQTVQPAQQPQQQTPAQQPQQEQQQTPAQQPQQLFQQPQQGTHVKKDSI